MLLRTVLSDLRSHLTDESHASDVETYKLMRRLYIRSHGKTRIAWRLLFRLLRRSGPVPADPLGIAEEVRRSGYAVRPGFLSPADVATLREYLSASEGVARTGVRIDYPSATVAAAPTVRQLVQHPYLLAAARNYLGTEPILAGINAWQSLHDAEADNASYSSAAQLYHFDCDWPLFIKFFVYLTDVTEDDGPFALIEGSHREKPVWRDGRFDTDELLVERGLAPKERLLTGAAGTLIAADTSALHRGTPVKRGPRMVVQLEFAITRLGASGQYEPLPAALRPAAGGRHTFDIFAT